MKNKYYEGHAPIVTQRIHYMFKSDLMHSIVDILDQLEEEGIFCIIKPLKDEQGFEVITVESFNISSRDKKPTELFTVFNGSSVWRTVVEGGKHTDTVNVILKTSDFD